MFTPRIGEIVIAQIIAATYGLSPEPGIHRPAIITHITPGTDTVQASVFTQPGDYHPAVLQKTLTYDPTGLATDSYAAMSPQNAHQGSGPTG